jgi:hypothetical protein
MLDTKRRIYAQGDLDGACFLYSIVNAYVALTGRAPDFGRVCAAFAQVDHPADFLNASVGTTGHFDRDYALLQNTIERMLALLGGASPDSPRFLVTRIQGPFSAASLNALLDAKSVVILRYQGSSMFADAMDHWVCVVAHDAAQGRLHVACSVRHQRACNGAPCSYAETLHPEFGRWSNDQLCPERAYTVVEGEVFRVRLVTPLFSPTSSV